jgi:hypothetical protein
MTQTTGTLLAEEKTVTRWQTVADFEVLKLWETELGPRWPEIAILQLSNERHLEVQRDPLAFLRKYNIIEKADGVRSHSVTRIVDEKTGLNDSSNSWIVTIVHDSTTYSDVGSHEFRKIQKKKRD